LGKLIKLIKKLCTPSFVTDKKFQTGKAQIAQWYSHQPISDHRNQVQSFVIAL
jgi:hypothetical protein